MSRLEILLEKYCPTIYNLTKKSKKKIDWGNIDKQFETDYLKIGVVVESNIFGLLLHAESGEKFPKSFLAHCEFLTKSLMKITEQDRKFREILLGKITNFKDLNYLNPIGELSVLKKLTDSGYELIGIEDQRFFPEASPKDFLFKSKMMKKYLLKLLIFILRINTKHLTI